MASITCPGGPGKCQPRPAAPAAQRGSQERSGRQRTNVPSLSLRCRAQAFSSPECAASATQADAQPEMGSGGRQSRVLQAWRQLHASAACTQRAQHRPAALQHRRRQPRPQAPYPPRLTPQRRRCPAEAEVEAEAEEPGRRCRPAEQQQQETREPPWVGLATQGPRQTPLGH